MEISSKILELLEQIKPGLDFKSSTNYLEDGLLDSFDVVMIVSELTDAFDIKIGVNDLKMINFVSLDAIAELVNKLLLN